MVRSVNVLYVLGRNYKKTAKSHLPVDFEDSHQFALFIYFLTKAIAVCHGLSATLGAGGRLPFWQWLVVNTGRE